MRRLAILTLLALALGACDAPLFDFSEQTAPPPPEDGSLFARFSGTFTPATLATDGVCRLIVDSTTVGGTPPYTYSWDAATLAGGVSTAEGYPDGKRVVMTFPASYGAGATDPQLVRLVARDSEDTVDDATATKVFDCTSDASFSFQGF